MKIGIVDDDEKCREQLQGYIARYARESGENIETLVSSDGIHFVSDYGGDGDVVFLDVEMPLMDGITTAKRIREFDDTVSIVFLTNYSQYAINGYEVNAIDYVIKPMSYAVFCQKLKKALSFCARREHGEIVVHNETSVVRLPFQEILYVESERNYVVYHTEKETYRERSTMRAAQEKFGHSCFAMCNAGMLINLSHVRKVVDNELFIDNQIMQISRGRKKEFMDKYIDYLSRGCC